MKLPDKLSDLMELAYNHAVTCVREGYQIDMFSWVRKKDDGTCTVCLAGAVMVKELNANSTTDAVEIADDEACRKIFCINCMRGGLFHQAYSILMDPSNIRACRNLILVFYTLHYVTDHNKQALCDLEKEYRNLRIDPYTLDLLWPIMIQKIREAGL